MSTIKNKQPIRIIAKNVNKVKNKKQKETHTQSKGCKFIKMIVGQFDQQKNIFSHNNLKYSDIFLLNLQKSLLLLEQSSQKFLTIFQQVNSDTLDCLYINATEKETLQSIKQSAVIHVPFKQSFQEVVKFILENQSSIESKNAKNEELFFVCFLFYGYSFLEIKDIENLIKIIEEEMNLKEKTKIVFVFQKMLLNEYELTIPHSIVQCFSDQFKFEKIFDLMFNLIQGNYLPLPILTIDFLELAYKDNEQNERSLYEFSEKIQKIKIFHFLKHFDKFVDLFESFETDISFNRSLKLMSLLYKFGMQVFKMFCLNILCIHESQYQKQFFQIIKNKKSSWRDMFKQRIRKESLKRVELNDFVQKLEAQSQEINHNIGQYKRTNPLIRTKKVENFINNLKNYKDCTFYWNEEERQQQDQKIPKKDKKIKSREDRMHIFIKSSNDNTKNLSNEANQFIDEITEFFEYTIFDYQDKIKKQHNFVIIDDYKFSEQAINPDIQGQFVKLFQPENRNVFNKDLVLYAHYVFMSQLADCEPIFKNRIFYNRFEKSIRKKYGESTNQSLINCVYLYLQQSFEHQGLIHVDKNKAQTTHKLIYEKVNQTLINFLNYIFFYKNIN